MGSYLSFHIGPYILVRRLKYDTQETKSVCVSEDCKKYNKELHTPFCSLCGSKVVSKNFPIKEEKNINDILHSDKFVDELYRAHNGGTALSKEWEILIPNHKMPNGINFDEDGGWAEIKPDRMSRELKWMFEKYTDVIAAIVKEYGEDNVKFEWGIVKHYN